MPNSIPDSTLITLDESYVTNKRKQQIANLVIKNIVLPIARSEKPRKDIYKIFWK